MIRLVRSSVVVFVRAVVRSALNGVVDAVRFVTRRTLEGVVLRPTKAKHASEFGGTPLGGSIVERKPFVLVFCLTFTFVCCFLTWLQYNYYCYY